MTKASRCSPRAARLPWNKSDGQYGLNEELKTVCQSATFCQRLDLAINVHASAIKETIELRPRPQP
ncbi:MAG TPA: hypothetical protein P5159_11355 [Phycisphaerae bacterium]|nr:hypothetical protein [Phycisphaerae bacterium]